MARERKYNFQKILTQKPKPEVEHVSLYKNGSFVIPQNILDSYGLNNKIVEFVYDPIGKAFGFRKVEGNLHGELSKTMKQVNSKNGKAIVGVGRILKFAGVEKKNWGALPLNKYKDNSLLENGFVYFVKLK